jgi:hypothetical protein
MVALRPDIVPHPNEAQKRAVAPPGHMAAHSLNANCVKLLGNFQDLQRPLAKSAANVCSEFKPLQRKI